MKPKVYPKHQHQISRTDLDPEAVQILDTLASHGYESYLVGGGVRDLILGYTPKDFDIATAARPQEIVQIFKRALLIGRRFPLAHVRIKHQTFEVSTFRAGDNETDRLVVKDNLWGTPEEDALRRDFTINALFYDSKEEQIIDYVGGYQDLKQRHLLKTIGQAYLRFKQDPVRMMRCLKFQARFDFKIDAKTRLALLECRREITNSSQARVLEEMLRILESGKAYPFFLLMHEYGLLPLLFPFLAKKMVSSSPQSVGAFLQEIDKWAPQALGYPSKRPALLAALLFPIFNERLQLEAQQANKHPHLGIIHDKIMQVMRESFSSFFHIPRRMKYQVIDLILAQYRMAPLDPKTRPQLSCLDPTTLYLAYHLFEMRCAIDPSLNRFKTRWNITLPIPPPDRPKRRYRRRSSGARNRESTSPPKRSRSTPS